MKFVGKAWRLLVGIKDGLVLIFMLLFFAGLYGALSASPYRGSAARGALRLDLAGTLVEQPATRGPFEAFGGSPATREYRLAALVHALDEAAADDHVKAVALDLDSFAGGGQTAVTDLGAALDRFRRSGKRVVAYATGYADDGYQLAAHADEIWLDPLGTVLIAGPGGANLYYAGLMQRLGITANVYRVGAFKSAVEPFTRSDMSPEAREASQTLANALWGAWQQDVHQARPRAQVAQYVANMPAFVAGAGGDMARAALAAGLVDHIGDRTAFGRRMAELAGADDDAVAGSYHAIHLDAYVHDHEPSRSGGHVAVLTVAGTIVDGNARAGTAGGDTIARALEQGLQHDDIRALVVRVDSPGGSVTGSERIRRAVMTARARGIPVVISMGSVAASGGYWVATAGDVIFAEPSTITGSIGVFGILPSFQGTLQKLGVGVDGVATTPLSGQPDVLRGPSPEASQLLQMGVEGTYRRFISLVARARHLPPARVNEIAQGHVWDGGTAHQLGLVDRFGSLGDAIAEAARRAHLDGDDARPRFLEREPGWLGRLLANAARGDDDDPTTQTQARDAFASLAQRPEALVARAIAEARQLVAGPAIQARCLECAAWADPTPPQPQMTAPPSALGWLLSLVWQG